MAQHIYMQKSERIALVSIVCLVRKLTVAPLLFRFAGTGGACKAVVINIKRTHITGKPGNRSRAKN